MSYIPIDLIAKILHKTPAESLLRFKPTCKEWYDLINDKEFMYKHFDHSPERFIRASGDDQTVHNFDPVTAIHSAAPMPNEFRLQHRIDKMVHCDGLMLCVSNGLKYERPRISDPDNLKLAIWNPVLRNIKWIEPDICFRGYDYFGIGYDKKSRDSYKIYESSKSDSWIWLHEDFGDHGKCKIYESSKSDSWKTIDAKFAGRLRSEGVCVKGNMYWIVDRNMMSLFIISFDFSTETFKDICIFPNYWDVLLGCFNRDGLSLLRRVHPREIHVWMTNKLSDETVSFTEYFNVVLPTSRPHYPMHRPAYSLVKHRKNMSWCELTVQKDGRWSTTLTLYNNLERGEIINSETGLLDSTYYCDPETRSYVYAPSLIPVPR